MNKETSNFVDVVNKPPHYNSRSVQCIEFTEHLGFNLGNAFKYVWRTGLKDDAAQELGKVNWYLVRSIQIRPQILHEVLFTQLSRKLMLMANEFEPEQLTLLLAILTAALGDYAMIEVYLKEKKVLNKEAHELFFDEVQAA